MEWNVSRFLETLPYMLKGMVGIFAVTLVIIAMIWLINRLTGGKQ